MTGGNAISEVSLQETLADITAGMSEKHILNQLKTRMLANGTDGFAFEPIVLTGGNAANPHGHAGDYQLQAGDPLLIDFGAYYQGYSADITRTFFCQHATDEHAALYHTVKQANQTGRRLASPKHTALAAMAAINGPPWFTGNTARSMAWVFSSVVRMNAPRGPRNDLWVVDVTI